MIVVEVDFDHQATVHAPRSGCSGHIVRWWKCVECCGVIVVGLDYDHQASVRAHIGSQSSQVAVRCGLIVVERENDHKANARALGGIHSRQIVP